VWLLAVPAPRRTADSIRPSRPSLTAVRDDDSDVA